MIGSSRQVGTARVRGPLLKVMLATAFATAAALGAIMTGPIHAEGATTGSVSSFGGFLAYGSPSGDQLIARLTGMASTPDGKGYWLVGADGGIFSYGNAGFFGSDGGSATFFPYVGIAATPSGHGYWVTNTFGTTGHFGDAADEGSLGTLGITPAAPMVGITATSGAGYWLVAADGGVFSFGDAAFQGSMGGKALNAPVVGMARTPDGGGYWLVAADGGVFSFGDAAFYGSMGGKALNAPIVGMAASADGNGYWLVAADGGVFSFGTAAFLGSLGANPPPATTPVVGVAADASGAGYWLTTTDKALPPATSAPSVLSECNVPTAGPAVRPTTDCAGMWRRQCTPVRSHLDLVDIEFGDGNWPVHPQHLRAQLCSGHIRHVVGAHPTRLPDTDGSWSTVRIGQLRLRECLGTGRLFRSGHRDSHQLRVRWKSSSTPVLKTISRAGSHPSGASSGDQGRCDRHSTGGSQL